MTSLLPAQRDRDKMDAARGQRRPAKSPASKFYEVETLCDQVRELVDCAVVEVSRTESVTAIALGDSL
jgi:hypothetical protein